MTISEPAGPAFGQGRADRGCPVVDFDHYAGSFSRDPLRAHRAMREQSPLVFSPQYGGFYVATSYETVSAVARDDVTFSSKKSTEPEDGVMYGGLVIPATATKV